MLKFFFVIFSSKNSHIEIQSELRELWTFENNSLWHFWNIIHDFQLWLAITVSGCGGIRIKYYFLSDIILSAIARLLAVFFWWVLLFESSFSVKDKSTQFSSYSAHIYRVGSGRSLDIEELLNGRIGKLENTLYATVHNYRPTSKPAL